MGESGDSSSDPGPCRRHGCHACCVDTNMTLTLADVARLEGSGWRDFARPGAGGKLCLRVVGGACVFLRDGGCVVYPYRPEGCGLYPLVLDAATDAVVRDDFCPYHLEFRFTRGDELRLRRSVADEEREAVARVAVRPDV